MSNWRNCVYYKKQTGTYDYAQRPKPKWDMCYFEKWDLVEKIAKFLGLTIWSNHFCPFVPTAEKAIPRCEEKIVLDKQKLNCPYAKQKRQSITHRR